MHSTIAIYRDDMKPVKMLMLREICIRDGYEIMDWTYAGPSRGHKR